MIRGAIYTLGLSLFILGTLLWILRLESPTSRWIVFQSERDGEHTIYRMHPDGSHLERLTDPQFSSMAPALGYGDEWVMFTIQRGRGQNLIAMNIEDHTEEIELVSQVAFEHAPRLSPDGQKLVYVSAQDVNKNIYVIPFDVANPVVPQQVTDSFGTDIFPTWSPDSAEIIFSSGRHLDWELYRMNADGSDVERITENPGYDGEPHWSPDGEWIVFTSFRDDNFDIFKMRPDGSDRQALTDDLADDRFPVWSADGQWIAFVSNRADDNNEIYRMRADGSDVERLTNDPEEDTLPAWSPPLDLPYTEALSVIAGLILVGVGQVWKRPRLIAQPIADVNIQPSQ